MQFTGGRSVGIVALGVALAAGILVEGVAVDAQGRPAATRPAAPAARQAAAPQAWPTWRGPLGTGEAPAATPPLEWSETKNIKWKVALPGLGKSSPIVWRDTVYLTSAVPGDAGALKFSLIALNRADGKEKWTRVLRQEKPHEGHHPEGTFAGGSALTDGTRLYAWFGSRGLYAIDFTGKVLWEKSLGQMQTRNGFGEGSSVAIHDGTLVVPWDHEGADFVIGLDAATGTEKWRTPRDEPTTWSTPLVVVAQGVKPQVVLSGTNKVAGYDLATGAVVWQTGGTTVNAIPSPVFGDGLVIAMGGFRGSMARAIRVADAKGEIDGTAAQVWTYTKDTPYVPSPLLYRGSLYFLKVNTGILTNLDAKTGAVRFTERLTETPNVYASPVGADGRVYVVGREGKTSVLEAGPTLKVLATNVLDDATDTSPALVDGELYLRGAKSLYRISAN